MRRELAPVRAERVRLDQLGARVDEADVQRDDRIGRAQVRLLGGAQRGTGLGQARPMPPSPPIGGPPRRSTNAFAMAATRRR